MTQPPNYPGDNQGGYPPHDPNSGSNPPQGGFPPPPGGFPPPPGGSYPPPSGPGAPQYGGGPQYGQPGQPYGGQPGQPGQPYGQPYGDPQYAQPYGQPYGGPQYGGQPPFDFGNAFSWAWNKFTKFPAQLIVPILVYGLALAAVVFLLSLVLGVGLSASVSTSADGTGELSNGGAIGIIAGTAVLVLVMTILSYLVQSAYLNGLFEIADGRPADIGAFFKPRNAGQVIIAALIFGVVGAVLSLVPILGILASIVVSFFGVYATFVIVDRRVSAIEGIKQAFAVVKANPGMAILAYFVAVVLVIVGAFLCGIGLLVAVPIASLLMVNTYRSISGGYVAPAIP